MVTIVFAHPWHGSFNAAILDTIISKLNKDNRAYQLIDLYKDEFNPVMTEKELSFFNKGESPYELTLKYQSIIKNTDEIVFIFPIWWGSAPAILKGFFDKVMLKGFAYNYGSTGLVPLLNIDKTTVVTTSESAGQHFKPYIEGVFIPQMLHETGINNATWFNNEGTSTGTDAQRKEFMKKVADQI